MLRELTLSIMILKFWDKIDFSFLQHQHPSTFDFIPTRPGYYYSSSTLLDDTAVITYSYNTSFETHVVIRYADLHDISDPTTPHLLQLPFNLSTNSTPSTPHQSPQDGRHQPSRDPRPSHQHRSRSRSHDANRNTLPPRLRHKEEL